MHKISANTELAAQQMQKLLLEEYAHLPDVFECKQLFDKKYWDGLTPAERKQYGRILAIVSKQPNSIIVTDSQLTSARHNQYRKK